jgi:SAM-dependent methyltransferase
VERVRAGLGRLLGDGKQVRFLREELAEERRKVERLKDQNRRLKRRAQGFTRKGGEGGRRVQVGNLRFGDFRRLDPISREFGLDRGRPIDRYYIENFLAHQTDDIRGRVLEIGDDTYTRQYGGERVEHADVLHVTEGNPQATFVADLTRADHIPSDAFDCIIFTQTLHLIYDVRLAIRTLSRILKPGGILLATFPGISQIAQDQWGEHWYWAFTTQSARRLFEETFPAPNVEIEAHGNVLAAVSFLHGLAVEELNQKELDCHEPAYEVLITLRAMKPKETP